MNVFTWIGYIVSLAVCFALGYYLAWVLDIVLLLFRCTRDSEKAVNALILWTLHQQEKA